MKCKFCKQPLQHGDYDSIPAHVACVIERTKAKIIPQEQPLQTKFRPCGACGKSDSDSPRRKLGSGLRAKCQACERAAACKNCGLTSRINALTGHCEVCEWENLKQA